MKKLSVFASMLVALLLSACSQLHFPTASVSEAKSVSDPLAKEDAALKAIRETAQRLPSFTYETGQQTATAYFNQQQITFITVKSPKKVENIYLKNGRVAAVINDQHYYDFSKGNLNNEQLAAEKAAEKWVQKLGYNSADRNISAVRTGDEAKLNYLCIAKIQQVAGTKKVLRTSANSAQSTSRLTASMRLNGNKFYQMDCVLSGDRVAKLSLIAK